MKTAFLERLLSRKRRLQRLRSRILAHYASLPQADLPEDQQEVVKYLQDHDLCVFPYGFVEGYDPSDIGIFRDPDLKLHYTLWEGKRLYYKSVHHESKARRYFHSLRLEQDLQSPHRYLTDTFNVGEGDIVADVGAAEGNFSLSVIERAGHIHLFEPDQDWVRPLEATFAPWRDKVTIVNKFASDRTSADAITLDDYFRAQPVIHFLKADVEGAEGALLRGSAGLVERQQRLKIAVCTYHRQEDAGNLDAWLRSQGFRNEFSAGYMIYHYGRDNVVREPYLRRGVLRATKP